MSALTAANLSECPDHPVLADPHLYDVVSVSYCVGEAPYGSLDLGLKKEGKLAVLRFEGVHELEIDAGFPHSCMGLEILDVTSLGWEHTRVRVESYEDAPAIRFWAKDVCRTAA